MKRKYFFLLLSAMLMVRALPAQQPVGPVSTLESRSRLVLVDVVVTDGAGRPVKGLKPEDFRLTERKAPQTIRHFEEHMAAALPAVGTVTPKLQPGVFTNVGSAEAGDSALTVILLDSMNTPVMDQLRMRAQLLRYLQNPTPGARTAIFALTGRLVMLQGFTSDPGQLRAAIEAQHAGASAALINKVGGGNNIFEEQKKESVDQMSGISPEQAFALAEFARAEQTTGEEVRSDATLQAMNQLARFLAGVPGRKNLIWCSAGFPLNMLPIDRSHADAWTGRAAWDQEYQETVRLLAQGQIAVFPLDARGLMVDPVSIRTGAVGAFHSGVDRSQSTMLELAEATGGKAFMNTNGLSQAVAEVADAGSEYYTLAYRPSDDTAAGEFRSIRVETPGHRYELTYRRGYYAEPAPGTVSVEAGKALRAAMAFGTPPATQIGVFARVSPLAAGDPPVVSPGEPPPKQQRVRQELTREAYSRYLVEYSVAPQSLSVTATPDGLRHGHLEFMALAWGADGRLLNSAVKRVQIAWTPAQFASVLQHGLRYQQEIHVPAQGTRSLRLLVHDLSGGEIGAVDVPLREVPAAVALH